MSPQLERILTEQDFMSRRALRQRLADEARDERERKQFERAMERENTRVSRELLAHFKGTKRK